jgi:hypothetical protein
MASDAELQTLAAWLEKEGFAHKRYRDITLSYLNLAFGDCTAPQLKVACKTLLRLARAHDDSQKHRKPWDRTKLRVSWLGLRKMVG